MLIKGDNREGRHWISSFWDDKSKGQRKERVAAVVDLKH